MLSLVAKFQSRFGTLRRDETGQDAFEYLLVIGAVMVAIVGAVIAGVTPDGLVADIMTKVKADILAKL